MLLYHAPNSAASQKVRLVLHEKGLSFDEKIIDLANGDQFSESYRAKNPNAVVPTLLDDEQILIESSLIIEYLEEKFGEPALMPECPAKRHQVRLILRKLDALHQACGDISYALLSYPIKELYRDERIRFHIQQMTDPVNREHRLSVMQHGIHAPEFLSGVQVHRRLFNYVDELLKNQDFLLGEHISVSDLSLIIYVARLDHLALTHEIEKWPHLSRWYNANKTRPAVLETFGGQAAPVIELMNNLGLSLSKEIESVLS